MNGYGLEVEKGADPIFGGGGATGVSAGLFGGSGGYGGVVNFFSQIAFISCTIPPLIINFHYTNYSYVRFFQWRIQGGGQREQLPLPWTEEKEERREEEVKGKKRKQGK